MPSAYASSSGPRSGVAPARRNAAIAALRAARHARDEVLLEGVHAVKHAVRFGAELTTIATVDPAAMHALFAEFAPDVGEAVGARACTLDPADWDRVAPRGVPSPVLAVARRPAVDAGQVLAAEGVVLVLEQPRHLGNLGAAIRVAAAAGAAGVLVVGDADPYHPTAVRSAAGLQFALPVARTPRLAATRRTITALDAGGEPLEPGALGADTLLAVGTERGGLSPAMLARAERSLAVPMRAGVSSLNLATAVAVALYVGR